MDRAVAKFCNNLIGDQMMILEFALEIGSPPVRLAARSGECAPLAPQPCATIPIGNVEIKVIDVDDQSVLGMATAPIPGGAQVVFLAGADDTGQATIGMQVLPAQANCALLILDDGDGGTGGPSDAGTADSRGTPPPLRP
jgi:hypothetical protein